MSIARMSMHLVIATLGTRGNAQPYVAVGRELKRRGHRITVATHEDYRALVESNGLDFRSVCGSYRKILASTAGQRWINSSRNPIKFVRGFRRLFEPYAQDWVNDLDAALEDADAVIVNAVAAPALVALETRQIPRVILFTSPSVPSGKIGISGLPRIPVLTSWVERSMYKIVLNQAWSVGKGAQASYLASHDLRLPPHPLWKENIRRGIGHLHLFSEAIVPRPVDWPQCAEVTGFCFLDAPQAWEPPEELSHFINSGPAPIYATYGSQSGMDPATLSSITIEALRSIGQRGVIGIKRDKRLKTEDCDDMFFIDDVAYEWLFPKMSAIVHYGGVGTASAVLRAGKPSLVTPFFSDQHFWAGRMARLGVSPSPIAKHEISSDRLAYELRCLLSEPSYAARAGEIGCAIQSEDGVGYTADRITHYLNTYSDMQT